MAHIEMEGTNPRNPSTGKFVEKEARVHVSYSLITPMETWKMKWKP